MVVPVQPHHWFAMACGIGCRTSVFAQGIEDEALDLVSGQGLDGLALAAIVVYKVEQHQQVTGLRAGFFGTAQHRHRKRIGDVGHHQADQS